MAEEKVAIVCSLTSEEFRERERDVIQRLMPAVIERSETALGFSYRFPSDDKFLRDVSEFIVLERECCPFLDFKLTVKRGCGALVLELSGPGGAKEFIASTFNK